MPPRLLQEKKSSFQNYADGFIFRRFLIFSMRKTLLPDCPYLRRLFFKRRFSVFVCI